MRWRVLPSLDGRRALDGDVAPGVELDHSDRRPACPLDVPNLDGARPGREAKLTIQHSRRDDGRLRTALERDADRDTGVIFLQQGKRFFPFHLRVPPKVKVRPSHDELGTY